MWIDVVCDASCVMPLDAFSHFLPLTLLPLCEIAHIHSVILY